MSLTKALVLLAVAFSCFVSSVCRANISRNELHRLAPQEAYEIGMQLRWQYKLHDARQYLRFAANHGVTNAMCMYSVMLLSDGATSTNSTKAYRYAKKAAHKGSECGVVLLANLSSQDHNPLGASKVSLSEDEDSLSNDSDFISVLFAVNTTDTFTEHSDEYYERLKMVSDNGNAIAQYALATAYQLNQFYGGFILSSSRNKEIRRLYKASADQGYIPAINAYVGLLLDDENYEEVSQYVQVAIRQGSANEILALADSYAIGGNLSQFKQNTILAASYYKVYFDSMAIDPFYPDFYNVEKASYESLVRTMSTEQKIKSEDLANQYLAAHKVRAFDDYWYLDQVKIAIQ